MNQIELLKKQNKELRRILKEMSYLADEFENISKELKHKKVLE